MDSTSVGLTFPGADLTVQFTGVVHSFSDIISQLNDLGDEMDVFISWSGPRSKGLAEALRDWLPKIINALKPWLSSADIDKGARWGVEVADKLAASKVGIICLTPGNLNSNWILFEAGALSKTLDKTHVCPLLLDLEPADVKGPLAQFQATKVTKGDIRQLLVTINRALGDTSLPAKQLEEVFEVLWQTLDDEIAKLPPDDQAPRPQRPEREILEEVLALVRSQARTAPAANTLAEVHSGEVRFDDDLRFIDTRLRTLRKAEIRHIKIRQAARRAAKELNLEFDRCRVVAPGADNERVEIYIKDIQSVAFIIGGLNGLASIAEMTKYMRNMMEILDASGNVTGAG